MGCLMVVLYFRTSEAMTAAYGFSITIAMLMTTVLMYYFLRYIKHYPFWIVGAIVTVFVLVEGSFFVANAVKLLKRLFFLVFEIGLIGTMYVWYNARNITLRLLIYVKLSDYLPQLRELSNNNQTPKYATNVVYLTKTQRKGEIEKRILDSIFRNPSKRADVYWFINIDRADDPYTMEYGIEQIVENKVIMINFRLGFRIQPRIGVMLKMVVDEMRANKELAIKSQSGDISTDDYNDFKFVILERFLSYDNEFSTREKFILNSYFTMIKWARSDREAYGIDLNQAVFEKVPLVVSPVTNIKLTRAYYKNDSGGIQT